MTTMPVVDHPASSSALQVGRRAESRGMEHQHMRSSNAARSRGPRAVTRRLGDAMDGTGLVLGAERPFGIMAIGTFDPGRRHGRADRRPAGPPTHRRGEA